MNGSPFMLQGADPPLVTTKRCTRVPAAPSMSELATLTPLVAQACRAAVVVVGEVVGVGAVVVDVVTAGLLEEGVDEQAASPSAAPRTSAAVWRNRPERAPRLGEGTGGTRHVGTRGLRSWARSSN